VTARNPLADPQKEVVDTLTSMVSIHLRGDHGGQYIA